MGSTFWHSIQVVPRPTFPRYRATRALNPRRTNVVDVVTGIPIARRIRHERTADRPATELDVPITARQRMPRPTTMS